MDEQQLRLEAIKAAQTIALQTTNDYQPHLTTERVVILADFIVAYTKNEHQELLRKAE